MGPIFTYLCCQPHVHFLQLTGVDMRCRKLWYNFQLVFFLSFVKLLVVVKVDFVCASLKDMNSDKMNIGWV